MEFETNLTGVAAPAQAGDLLVWRFSASNAAPGSFAVIPNGDGPNSSGRIPNLTLPVIASPK